MLGGSARNARCVGDGVCGHLNILSWRKKPIHCEIHPTVCGLDSTVVNFDGEFLAVVSLDALGVDWYLLGLIWSSNRSNGPTSRVCG